MRGTLVYIELAIPASVSRSTLAAIVGVGKLDTGGVVPAGITWSVADTCSGWRFAAETGPTGRALTDVVAVVVLLTDAAVATRVVDAGRACGAERFLD